MQTKQVQYILYDNIIWLFAILYSQLFSLYKFHSHHSTEGQGFVISIGRDHQV